MPQEDWSMALLLVLSGVTIVRPIVWRQPFEKTDNFLMLLNAGFYLLMIGFLWVDLRDWMGSLLFSLALFHGIRAGVGWKRNGPRSLSCSLASILALLFVSIAIPVQLGDNMWTTMAWSFLAAVLVWLSFKVNFPLFRLFSYAAFTGFTLRLLVLDSPIDVRQFVPLLNERFYAYFIAVAAIYVSGALIKRNKEQLLEGEKGLLSVYPILFTLANFLSLLVLSMELWGYFSRQIIDVTPSADRLDQTRVLRSIRNLALTMLWAVYSVGLLVVGIRIRSRTVRVAGLILITIPIAKVFVYDVFALEQLYRIIAFVGLGLLLIASGYLYQRYRVAIKDFIVER
jgi:uncharacterized membrane protein